MSINEKEITISDLIELIKNYFKYIFLSISIFVVIGVFISLYIPNKYTAETLLSPQSTGNDINLPSGIGGIASLAGINLGSLNSNDNAKTGFEILKSRGFIINLIDKYDLLPKIVASKSWDRVENKVIYDPEIYDETKNKWTRKVKYPKKQIPSLLEAHEIFLKSYSVNRDKESGMIVVSFKHVSPYFAKEVIDLITIEINETLRTIDKNETISSISYLQKMIDESSNSEIRNLFYSLLEEKNKSLLLINIRDQYVFKIIDHPVVKEKKSEPRRAVIVLVFAFIGLFFSIILIMTVKLISNLKSGTKV